MMKELARFCMGIFARGYSIYSMHVTAKLSHLPPAWKETCHAGEGCILGLVSFGRPNTRFIVAHASDFAQILAILYSLTA